MKDDKDWRDRARLVAFVVYSVAMAYFIGRGIGILLTTIVDYIGA